jgi:hypothetical protein
MIRLIFVFIFCVVSGCSYYLKKPEIQIQVLPQIKENLKKVKPIENIDYRKLLD